MTPEAHCVQLFRGWTVGIRTLVVALACLISSVPVSWAASTPEVIESNRSLGRGVNLGNALEAPAEGEWGLTLEAGWFDVISNAGFDSVRVPIRWSAHASRRAPFRIDESFFERIDWVLEQTRRTGLATIINVHHYDELMADPSRERKRYLAIWKQIAERYRSQPDNVVFELLNEPHGAFNDRPELWNALVAVALKTVRRSNPSRAVMVGPTRWQSIDQLEVLQLPDDPNLIVSVHYYEPFHFTHQGATWVTPTPPVGEQWSGSKVDLSGGVQNWSWDTESVSGSGALAIRYGRRYAGWSARFSPMDNPRTLRLTVRGKLNLNVGCADDSGDMKFVDELRSDSDNWTTIRATLSDCQAGTTRVALMNNGAERSTFDVRVATICGSRCQRLVSSAALDIVDRLRLADRWGAANQRPVNIGEFGAYGAGDYASRVRWTRTVQRYGSRFGLSTHYWEFGAGFGLYNPGTRQWRTALRNAVTKTR